MGYAFSVMSASITSPTAMPVGSVIVRDVTVFELSTDTEVDT